MTNLRNSLTKRLLIAGLLAVPMMFSAGDVLAKSCKSGKCGGGPSNLEIVMKKIESTGATVSSGDLESAYEEIESVADQAEDLNVDSNSKVRGGLKELAGKLEKRASSELKDAIDRYFEGYHDEAIAKFTELSELNGLPSAKKAQQELDKEDDRVAWREANKLATDHIAGKTFGQAREPLNEMQRLARRTNYDKQTATAMKDFAKQMLSSVEAGEELIAQEQFDSAYATLIEISRLTHARESASAARKALGKNASLEGMRQAKAEYEAGDALAQAKSWFAEIANPSNKEQRLFLQKLEGIANNYKGTAAAEKAQQLLVSDDAQAAR